MRRQLRARPRHRRRPRPSRKPLMPPSTGNLTSGGAASAADHTRRRHGRRRRHAPARARRARRHRRAGRLREHSEAARTVPIKRRTALPVRVSKPGYAARTVRMPFKQRRRVTVRLYRDALQWTMYGANNRRTQAPADIKLRPPFKVVWSRGVGSLVEFPAVVADGVAYVANYKGHVYALRMGNGKVIWRHRPSRGKMASSPAIVGNDLVVHGMDGIVRVLDRRNGRLRWHFRIGSPIESSPIVSRRARLLRRLERPRLRARPEAAEAALELSHGLQDHLERRDRGEDALHRRLRRPPARARRAHGQAALRPLGQRPRLRHAGCRRGSRLRPLVDRQQPDRLLHVRPLSLARRHRRLRLLLARRLGGTRLLRLLQRAALLGVREERPRALERPHRRAGLGRRRRRRRRRLCRLDLGPDHRGRREERPRSC